MAIMKDHTGAIVYVFDASVARTGRNLPATGIVLGKRPTWGARALRRSIRVLRIEPATQTRRFNPDDRDSPIDGELYTPDCRRGNLKATVIKGGTVNSPNGSTFKLHPFKGASKGAGVGNALPVRVYLGKRQSRGRPASNTTQTTARIPDEQLFQPES